MEVLVTTIRKIRNSESQLEVFIFAYFFNKTYATYANNQGFKKVDNHSFCKILIL